MMAEHGIEGRGVDSDPGMVSRCRERGLTVASGDLVEQLAQAGDRTLGTIFCAQVIEHLPVTQLWKLLDLALVKLVPGGRMIAETVNPHSVAALKMFWIDPTHQNPIFPEVALAMAGITGFAPAFVFAPGDSGFRRRGSPPRDTHSSRPIRRPEPPARGRSRHSPSMATEIAERRTGRIGHRHEHVTDDRVLPEVALGMCGLAGFRRAFVFAPAIPASKPHASGRHASASLPLRPTSRSGAIMAFEGMQRLLRSRM